MKKAVVCGLDFLRDKHWKPVVRTRKGAQLIADRLARKEVPTGYWHGIVSDCGTYYRISFAGQKIM